MNMSRRTSSHGTSRPMSWHAGRLRNNYDDNVLSPSAKSGMNGAASTDSVPNPQLRIDTTSLLTTQWISPEMMARCYLKESKRHRQGTRRYVLKDKDLGNIVAAGSEDEIDELVLRLQSGQKSSARTPLTAHVRDLFPGPRGHSPRISPAVSEPLQELEEDHLKVPNSILPNGSNSNDINVAPNDNAAGPEPPTVTNDTADFPRAETAANEAATPSSNPSPPSLPDSHGAQSKTNADLSPLYSGSLDEGSRSQQAQHTPSDSSPQSRPFHAPLVESANEPLPAESSSSQTKVINNAEGREQTNTSITTASHAGPSSQPTPSTPKDTPSDKDGAASPRSPSSAPSTVVPSVPPIKTEAAVSASSTPTGRDGSANAGDNDTADVDAVEQSKQPDTGASSSVDNNQSTGQSSTSPASQSAEDDHTGKTHNIEGSSTAAQESSEIQTPSQQTALTDLSPGLNTSNSPVPSGSNGPGGTISLTTVVTPAPETADSTPTTNPGVSPIQGASPPVVDPAPSDSVLPAGDPAKSNGSAAPDVPTAPATQGSDTKPLPPAASPTSAGNVPNSGTAEESSSPHPEAAASQSTSTIGIGAKSTITNTDDNDNSAISTHETVVPPTTMTNGAASSEQPKAGSHESQVDQSALVGSSSGAQDVKPTAVEDPLDSVKNTAGTAGPTKSLTDVSVPGSSDPTIVRSVPPKKDDVIAEINSVKKALEDMMKLVDTTDISTEEVKAARKGRRQRRRAAKRRVVGAQKEGKVITGAVGKQAKKNAKKKGKGKLGSKHDEGDASEGKDVGSRDTWKRDNGPKSSDPSESETSSSTSTCGSEHDRHDTRRVHFESVDLINLSDISPEKPSLGFLGNRWMPQNGMHIPPVLSKSVLDESEGDEIIANPLTPQNIPTTAAIAATAQSSFQALSDLNANSVEQVTGDFIRSTSVEEDLRHQVDRLEKECTDLRGENEKLKKEIAELLIKLHIRLPIDDREVSPTVALFDKGTQTFSESPHDTNGNV